MKQSINVKVEISFKNDFIPFLQKHGSAVENYIQAVRYRLGLNTPSTKVATRIADLNPRQWISGMFTWSDTKEGVNYWQTLNDKWREYISCSLDSSGSIKYSVCYEGCDDPSDIASDIAELMELSIQGKYYTVTDLSYSRPVKEEFEDSRWKPYFGEEIRIGEKFLVLSDFPEEKKMSWHGSIAIPKPMIKVWVPRLNVAYWVFFIPTNLQK